MKKRNRHAIGCSFTKQLAKLIGIALILSLGGTMNTASAQTTWYVSTDGADDNGGTGWEDAFATIQKGIDASSNGDTVLVADGTYTGAGNKNIEFLSKNPTVRSVSGPESCIIDLQNDGKGFLMLWGEAPVIDGFTIMNGRPAVDTDYGVGVTCYWCTAIIRNCIIKNNSGVQHGAGIDIRGNPSHPLIINCIFAGNQTTQSSSAVSIYGYGVSATLINCTFYGNTSYYGTITEATTIALTNCVFWGNTPTTIGEGPDISYSDVEGGYTGTGNINLPPDFVDPDNGDFRLSSGSDCIDAGLNSVAGLPGKDLDGKPRLIDGDGDLTATADMGAFEYGDICECDYPLEDLDTDGSDLAAYINDAGGLELRLLVSDFGRSDCPVYAATP
jgi:hypothetical protein